MIYIITAVHNRYKITEKFVNVVLSQTYPDIKLVLVDDGSTDGTAEMVRSLMPDAVILTGNGNLWWGGALHMAYLWVKENLSQNPDDIVMFANDDTVFGSDYIERAVNVLEKHKKTLLAGYGISRQTGKVFDGAITFDYIGLGRSVSETGYGNCASTRNLFFRVSDFLEIGGFYPKLLPHYGSDYEWTLRAVRKYGYTVFCDETLTYEMDEETTGEKCYETITRKKFFGKRSILNPFYKLSFIFLAVPVKLIPKSLFYQLKRYANKIFVFAEILKR